MSKKYRGAGANTYYELGLGDAVQRNAHIEMSADWLVVKSSTDSTTRFSLGIRSDGSLWGVGDNIYNQLGGLTGASYNNWTRIGTATDWIDVAPMKTTSIVLKSNGAAYAVGINNLGQCGVGTTTAFYTTLTLVSGSHVFTKIFAFRDRAYGIDSAGVVWSWGENGAYGHVGVGTTTAFYTTPQQITALTTACSTLALSQNYSMALLTSGKIYTWGFGGGGVLAHGSTTTYTTPTQVGTATTWAGISAGFVACFAIDTSGRAWSCGDNTDFGNAQSAPSNVFVQIGTDTDWAQVAGGQYGVMLRKTTGSIWVIGYNASGWLGTGSTTAVTTLSNLETTYSIVFPAYPRSISASFYDSFVAFDTPPDLISVPTTLTVAYPNQPSITAPTRLSVTSTGSLSAPTTLALISPGYAPQWTARCLVDGVDVSAQLTREASVTADEGAARIASITLKPATGTIAPLNYVGKSITFDYVLLINGVSVPIRLFTGRIDTPSYDLSTRLLQLDCVDDLQNRVALLPRGVIDGLVGGRYSVAVQGTILDNWDYALARLSTVTASLDAGPHGGLRVTPWQSSPSWVTYGAGDLLYEQSVLTLPQRSTLINQVDIAFDYRYPRLRQRYTTVGWSGGQGFMAPAGYAYPTAQDFLGAAGGSGWTVTAGVFFPAPTAIPHSSGGFIYPEPGGVDMAILHLTQRHSQTVTEAYTVTVTAPESIADNGVLINSMRGALGSSFEAGAWESALDVLPLMPNGGEQDWAPDATRSNANYAIQTLLDQANVKILGSHRGALVTNAVLCNPDLDLDKRVTIATTDMAVAGKVANVTHVLDFLSGSATTEFSIACFGAGGAGIITPSPLAPPSAPSSASATDNWSAGVPPLFVNVFGVTPYNDNLMGLLINPPATITVKNIPPDLKTQSFPNASYVAGSYPVTGFRVRMPGVSDADRNPITNVVSSSYQVLIPSDPFTFTVP